MIPPALLAFVPQLADPHTAQLTFMRVGVILSRVDAEESVIERFDISELGIVNQIKMFKDDVGPTNFIVIAGGASFQAILGQYTAEFSTKRLNDMFSDILEVLNEKDPGHDDFEFTEFVTYVVMKLINAQSMGDQKTGEPENGEVAGSIGEVV